MKKHNLFPFLLLIFLILASAQSLDAATATVRKAWLEHGVKSGGRNAMNVHCDFTVQNLKGLKGNVNVWLFDAGKKVLSVNSSAKSTDGTGFFYEYFTPSYDDSHYSDFEITVLLDDLNLKPGKHDYYILVTVNYSGKEIARSEFLSFTGTGPSNNNNHNHNHNNANNNNGGNGSKQVVKSWRVDNPMGGYTDYTQYADGSGSSHTVQTCYFCHGSAVCSVCHGSGGTYNAYTGIYYPCGSCLQQGKCKYCSGTGTQHFYTTTDAAGNGWGTSNGGNAPVYVGGGGNSGGGSSHNHNSGGSSGNSSRYGYYSCPTCYGTGKCQTCGGDGIADSYYTGGDMVCPNCTSNRGKCSVCNGTGKKYGVK